MLPVALPETLTPCRLVSQAARQLSKLVLAAQQAVQAPRERIALGLQHRDRARRWQGKRSVKYCAAPLPFITFYL